MENIEPVDILVIGAGLSGTIVSDWLRRGGHDVTVVDAERMHAGSGPAACVMKPSWLTNLSKREQDQSMMVLDTLYGVQELKASINFGKQVRIFWVPPTSILRAGRYIKAQVVALRAIGNKVRCELSGGSHVDAQKVIVAAGVWGAQLAPIPNLTGTKGVAFTWKANNFSGPDDAMPPGLPPPAIRVWAPYRQLLSIQRTPDELWVGDSTAVKPDSMTLERVQACLKRCSDFVGLPAGEAQHHFGIRPTIKGLRAPAFVEQVEPNIWVISGLAKNGTAGAGWAAHQLGEALK